MPTTSKPVAKPGVAWDLCVDERLLGTGGGGYNTPTTKNWFAWLAETSKLVARYVQHANTHTHTRFEIIFVINCTS